MKDCSGFKLIGFEDVPLRVRRCLCVHVIAHHITGVTLSDCPLQLRGMEGEGDSGPYTQAVGLIMSLRSLVNSVRVSTPKCCQLKSYGQSALNYSASCPCDCSLQPVAYTAFKPLINTPKSNIGFHMWQPIIGQQMLRLQPYFVYVTDSGCVTCRNFDNLPKFYYFGVIYYPLPIRMLFGDGDMAGWGGDGD